MTENEIRALVERRRDSMGRPRPRQEERQAIATYLRAEGEKGLSTTELSKRTGLSDKTIAKYLGRSSKPAKGAFRRLQLSGSKAFVIEGAAGLRVQCSDATSAAAVLVAAAKIG